MLSEVDVKDYKSDGWVQPHQGTKFDQDKAPIALVDPDFITGIAKVLAFGANKYAPDNWRQGIQYRRLISAAYRHLGEINKGNDLDEETGLQHSYHLGCCIMFLQSMIANRPDMDDRWKA